MSDFGKRTGAILLAVIGIGIAPAWSDTEKIVQLAQMDQNHMDHGSKMTEPGKQSQSRDHHNPKVAPVTTLKPADGAKLKIVAPTKGQTFKGDIVPVQFELTKGKRGHHAHAYVDGELMGMFESNKGTLNGVKQGKHVLEMRVVTSDHRTELDARDTVEFTVK